MNPLPFAVTTAYPEGATILTSEGRRFLLKDGRRIWMDNPPPFKECLSHSPHRLRS